MRNSEVGCTSSVGAAEKSSLIFQLLMNSNFRMPGTSEGCAEAKVGLPRDR